MWRGLTLGTLALVAACSGGDPAPGASTNAVELIHLVGDAGTTGTRFCVFITKKDANPPTCSEPREFRLFRDKDGKDQHCITRDSADSKSTKLPATATGGLQDLVGDLDSLDALIEGATVEVETALSARKKTIAGVAILGTAGFRDATGQVEEAKYAELWKRIASVYERRQLPVTARAMRPEDEARYSWLTIRFLHQRQGAAFSVIETGGGGCHFATGDDSAEYKDVKSASDPFGTSKLWQQYAADDVRAPEIATLKEPAFKVCYSGKPADPTGQNAEECVAFLRARAFDSAALAAAAKAQPAGRPLYGMGPAWNGLFNTYFPQRGSVSVADIHQIVVEECSRPVAEARGFIKHQSCFAAAFQEAFLRVTAGDTAVIRNGVESWPRGASISPGGEFPACKDSSIKVTLDPP